MQCQQCTTAKWSEEITNGGEGAEFAAVEVPFLHESVQSRILAKFLTGPKMQGYDASISVNNIHAVLFNH